MVRTKRGSRVARIRERLRHSLGPRQSCWPANWLSSVILVLVLTLAAILHVRSKLVVVQLGYQLSRATREHKRLLADSRKLQVEVATLRNPRRLRSLATHELGLREPTPGQIVRVQGDRRGKLAMGEP